MTVVGWRCIWVLNFISWIYHIFEIFSFLNPKAACPSLESLLQQHLLPNNKSVFIFWVHQNKEPQTTWFQTTQSSHQFPQGWDLKSRCWRVVPSHRLTWGLLVQPGWLVVEFSFCRSELACHFSSDQTVVSSSFSSYHTGSHIDRPSSCTSWACLPQWWCQPQVNTLPVSEWTHSRPWLHLQGLPMASLVFAQVTEKVVYSRLELLWHLRIWLSFSFIHKAIVWHSLLTQWSLETILVSSYCQCNIT